MTMAFAPTVTTGLVLFNVFVFVLISAFAMDDTMIGRAGNVYRSINDTGTGGMPSDISDSEVMDSGFFSRFFIILWDLPWWMNVFVVFVNVLLIPITIFAWARGL